MYHVFMKKWKNKKKEHLCGVPTVKKIIIKNKLKMHLKKKPTLQKKSLKPFSDAICDQP